MKRVLAVFLLLGCAGGPMDEERAPAHVFSGPAASLLRGDDTASMTDADNAPLAITQSKTPPMAEPGAKPAQACTRQRESGSARGCLPLSIWAPDTPPRAVILALHGFGDHASSTFAGPGAFWATRGLLTYAYDQRGFGRNPNRGRWPGAGQLIMDVNDIAAEIRAAHPGLPLYLLGHSMGGGAALAAVGEGLDVDGLILAAPAVWGGKALAFPYRALAWGGALILPEKRWTGEGIVRIQASDNIEMLRALGRDPLYLAPPSSREFLGLIRLMDRAAAAAAHVSVPTLTLYGAKDQVTARGPVEAAHARITAQKRMIIYPNGWHLLFRDLQAATVWEDIARWIEGSGRNDPPRNR